jgi:hypothetical protein
MALSDIGGSGGVEWGNPDVLGKLAAQGHAGAANAADQVAPVGELAHLQSLAKSKAAKLLAGRAFQKSDAKITTHRRLRESLQAFNFHIGLEHGGHPQETWCN